MGAGNLKDQLCKLLSELCDGAVHAESIQGEHRLREDLGLDSVALVDLAVALEERFAILLDPLAGELVAAFQTVGSLQDFVLVKQQGAFAP